MALRSISPLRPLGRVSVPGGFAAGVENAFSMFPMTFGTRRDRSYHALDFPRPTCYAGDVSPGNWLGC